MTDLRSLSLPSRLRWKMEISARFSLVREESLMPKFNPDLAWRLLSLVSVTAVR